MSADGLSFDAALREANEDMLDDLAHGRPSRYGTIEADFGPSFLREAPSEPLIFRWPAPWCGPACRDCGHVFEAGEILHPFRIERASNAMPDVSAALCSVILCRCIPCFKVDLRAKVGGLGKAFHALAVGPILGNPAGGGLVPESAQRHLVTVAGGETITPLAPDWAGIGRDVEALAAVWIDEVADAIAQEFTKAVGEMIAHWFAWMADPLWWKLALCGDPRLCLGALNYIAADEYGEPGSAMWWRHRELRERDAEIDRQLTDMAAEAQRDPVAWNRKVMEDMRAAIVTLGTSEAIGAAIDRRWKEWASEEDNPLIDGREDFEPGESLTVVIVPPSSFEMTEVKTDVAECFRCGDVTFNEQQIGEPCSVEGCAGKYIAEKP